MFYLHFPRKRIATEPLSVENNGAGTLRINCNVFVFYMNRKELRVIYSGTVQGVGFRWTVKQLARGYEVVGIVRNLPDRTVELIVQGQDSELKDFIQAIRDSGLGPLIRDEQIQWNPISKDCGHEKCFRGFEIA